MNTVKGGQITCSVMLHVDKQNNIISKVVSPFKLNDKTVYELLMVITCVDLPTILNIFCYRKIQKVPFKMGIGRTYEDMLYIRCLISINWNVSTHLVKI